MTRDRTYEVAGGIAVAILAILGASQFDGRHAPCSFDGLVIGCLISSRESLAGSLIGFGGGLFAAWLAWQALERQLRQNATLARLEVEAAMEALRIEFRPMLLAFNEFWRAIDLALLGDQAENTRQRRVNLVVSLAKTLPGRFELDLDIVSGWAEGLDPVDRQRFRPVDVALRATVAGAEMFDEQRREAPEKRLAPETVIMTIRDYLTALERALAEFDESLRSIFDGRAKGPPLALMTTQAYIARRIDAAEATKSV